jgi:hypothetical protein
MKGGFDGRFVRLAVFFGVEGLYYKSEDGTKVFFAAKTMRFACAPLGRDSNLHTVPSLAQSIAFGLKEQFVAGIPNNSSKSKHS